MSIAEYLNNIVVHEELVVEEKKIIIYLYYIKIQNVSTGTFYHIIVYYRYMSYSKTIDLTNI